jgi:hypothetical protein
MNREKTEHDYMRAQHFDLIGKIQYHLDKN